MKRTLTAAVALAATMGVAGLAMAQGTAPGAIAPTTTPQNPGMSPASPSTGTPGMTTGSSGNYQQPGALGNNQAMQGQQGTSPSGQQTSPASIQEAQQKLKSQGLYNGAIDGVNGPEMRSALLQFQQRNGLPQTGTLDQQTQARLMQSSSNGLSPTPTSGSSMQPGTGATQSPVTPPATNR